MELTSRWLTFAVVVESPVHTAAPVFRFTSCADIFHFDLDSVSVVNFVQPLQSSAQAIFSILLTVINFDKRKDTGRATQSIIAAVTTCPGSDAQRW